MRVDTCVCWYLRDLALFGLHVVPAKDHKDGYTATSMNKKSLKNRKRLRASSIFMDIRERPLFTIYLLVGNR